MILGASLRLRDNFTKTMIRAKRTTDQQARSMKTAQAVTGGVQKSTKQLGQQLKMYQSDLRATINRMDVSGNSMEALRVKSGSYTKQLGVQRQILSNLRAEHRRVAQAQGENSKEATRLATAVARANEAESRIERQVRRTNQAIREQSSSWQKLRTDMRRAYEDAKPRSTVDAMRTTGAALSGFGAVGGVMIGGMVRSVATFDDAMARVSAISGAAADEMQQLRDFAKDMGSTTRYSATEAAQAMEYLSLAGWNANQTIAALPDMLSLASAGALDLATASDIVTDTMSMFGMTADQASRAADIFAYAQSNANTNVKMLGEALSYVGPAAAAANMDLEQTSAVLAILADNGIKGSRGGTAMEAMLRDIRNSAEGGAIAIGNMAVSVYDSTGAMRDMTSIMADVEKATSGMTSIQRDAALGAVFQQESLRGVNVILGEGTEKLKDFEKGLYNSAGAAMTASVKAEDSLAGSFRSTGSAISGLVLSFENELKPVFTTLSDGIRNFATMMTGMPPGLRKLIAITALTAVGFALIGGPLLLLIGFLPSIAAGLVMVGSAFKALLIGSLNPITIGLVAIIAAGVLLYKNWDKIKDHAGKLKTGIVNLKNDAIDYLKDSLEKARDKFKEWQPVIEKTALILGAIFGPALIRSGAQAAIAGTKIAISFIASVVRAGTQSVISATKITASFIASMIRAGAQAVIAGAKITISFVGAMIRAAVQATVTAAIITGLLIASTLRYAASGWRAVFAITAQTMAWLIQRGAMMAGVVIMGLMTMAQWALNAAMMAAPYMWIIAAIIAVIAAGVLLYKNWDKVKGKAADAFGAIKKTVDDFVSSGIDKFNNFKDRIKEIWDDIKTFLKNPIKGTINLVERVTGRESGGGTKSHAAGIRWVPYDNYPALLHRGERVVPARDNRGGKGDTTVNQNVSITISGANKSPREIAEEVASVFLDIADNMGEA